MNPERIYVEVCALFSADGELLPIHIKWPDGRIFEIDSIQDIRRAPSEAGSVGIRYAVKILGHERCLFYENIYSETGKARWFVTSAKRHKSA